MIVPVATVVIPTLARDDGFLAALESLRKQTLQDIEIVLVDNSGSGRVRGNEISDKRVRVLAMPRNVGFGAAINAGWRASNARYIATLNDDAEAAPGWLEALVEPAETLSNVGMCASQVRFLGELRLDSAGMLICADGSSKQRGHGRPPHEFAQAEEVLCPSGSAALYRRTMLDELGGFADDFFLYCEDTDLGLRGRRAGWRCLYAPGAIVEHRYSYSAGRASALKAYYVERNRMYVAIRNLPLSMLCLAPLVTLARYAWHLFFLLRRTGSAARYTEGGSGFDLPRFVAAAHYAVLKRWAALWRERREIRSRARLSSAAYGQVLRQYRISARAVAAL